MNGSVGADFKARASEGRAQSIQSQDRLSLANQLEGNARRLQQQYIGHANVELRNSSIHAAGTLNSAAYALRVLRDKEAAASIRAIPSEG